MRIAITGGVASGKTTICKKLEVLGYYIFYSDVEAKILTSDNEIKYKIIKEFGGRSYLNNIYNVEYIRNIVFNNKLKLDILNSIFKNAIIDKYLILSNKYKISFFESALIFEHNLEKHFDCIIGVYCDKKEVYKRLKKRNNFTRADSNNIINNQEDNLEKMKKCDIVMNTTNWNC